MSANTKYRRSGSEKAAIALAAGAIASGFLGLAYVGGCPPPQRLLLPAQRTEFRRFKAECEQDAMKLVETGKDTVPSFICAELRFRKLGDKETLAISSGKER